MTVLRHPVQLPRRGAARRERDAAPGGDGVKNMSPFRSGSLWFSLLLPFLLLLSMWGRRRRGGVTCPSLERLGRWALAWTDAAPRDRPAIQRVLGV